MKYWFPSLLFMVSLIAFGPARAAATPEDIVHDVSDQIISRLKTEKARLEKDTNRLYSLVDEVIIPYFDFEGASRLILAQNWRVATDEQKTRFIEAFKKLMVHTYAQTMLEYADQKIVYIPMQQNEGGNVTVRTEVERTGQDAVPVYYRMHQKDGKWKVYDVFVGGISLVATRRSEFSDMVRRSGMDGLITQLENHDENTMINSTHPPVK